MKTVFTTILFTLMSCFWGCAPTIEKIQVTKPDGQPPAHGEPIHVEAYILPRSAGSNTPKLATKPIQPAGQAYSDAGTLPEREEVGPVYIPIEDDTLEFIGYRYYGDLSRTLEYGGYTMKVSLPYWAWFRTIEESATTNFLVDAPSSCFSFDTDLRGFTVGDVCNGLAGDNQICRELQGRWQSTNWPFGDVQPIKHGSMTFQILALIFQFDTPYWIVDFISPNLENMPEWQNARGVTMRLATFAGGSYAQPLFMVRDSAGTIKWWAPRDENEKYLVYPISSSNTLQWKVIEWVPTPTFAGVILELHIRIYGDSNMVGNNNEKNVYLDGVCPKPPGITPAGAEVVAPIPNPWQ